MQCVQGIAGRKLIEEQLETTDNLMKHMDQRIHAHHSSPAHMNHMDPSTMVFFTTKDLKLGKTMPIYFPKEDPSKSPRFLPRSEADLIPFSSEELPHLLEFFSFSKSSPQAKAMEATLKQCENKPIKGETKFCPTSLESMIEFTHSMLGPNTPFTVVTTAYLTNSTTRFQNYTILKEPEEIFAPKMVACHPFPYPYAVFYCHSQQSVNKLFKVELGGEDGDRIDAVAVCHLDTSNWTPNHASFSVLRIKPGTSDVCHFFPATNLVWVPTSTSV